MASFILRTFPEIYGDMVDALIAVTPVSDVNFGSVASTLLEAAAQEDDEQYFQMLEIIRGYSLDTTTGDDLDARAFEYGLAFRLLQGQGRVSSCGKVNLQHPLCAGSSGR